MLDIKLLRETPKEIEKKLKSKIPDIDIFKILSLDEEVRKIQKKTDDLKAKKNSTSKEIPLLKKEKKDVTNILNEMSKISEEISLLDKKFKKLSQKKDFLLSTLPNIPGDDAPVSLNVEDNKCIKTHKDKKTFDFPIKNHVELNENLKLFDFQRASKISKNRFSMYRGMGARLEWALINYMLDIHLQNGFMQIIPPLLVKQETMFGAAQLPKFADQLFRLEDKDYDLYLIPTAEVPLNGIHLDEILTEDELPLKYVAYTPCFRREAGAAGKNERGLIRTHQFNKVELFSLTKPENSEKVFNEMLASAEEVLKGLDLHYRNMLLCTGDMSFASAKTIDIEVFLPGQDRYYEVSSVSNCTDFQARRSKIRYRKKDEKPEFVHTLNASGVATSRLMVAILENFQQEDGSVLIPIVLRKYLDDQKYLTPKK
ncbi:MAG: Serine--tRNA ligase [Candidatus Anoxychlamydiales bacterium]|nr:Serine--tRNA ligase [Candidatus Anoxychlamydiales bacterium]NGX40599.1 Serine--tRNA ligase [Candidatus Anoxychlamydiales bacterium]HEU64271.1 serine--tRNA ligase [Chlamydiota bacterium]